MNLSKVNWTKVISIAGTVLGLVGTLATGYAQEKEMNKAVAEKVAEVLANK